MNTSLHTAGREEGARTVRQAVSPKEAERIAATVAQIPRDVASVLEIGFSDGRMSAALRNSLPVVYSLDLPRAVVDGYHQGRLFGTIESLPLKDASVELVTCCEVLEHLSDAVFQSGVREISRVAGRYLLLTVPNRQRVWNELSRCRECGYIGHYSSHLRMFTESSFADLLPGWSLEYSFSFGRYEHGYAPDLLYRMQFSLGAYVPRPWPCDQCQRTSVPQEPSFPGKALRSVIWRLEKLAKPQPPWLLFLWRRK